jgi:hypothetical protein
MLTVLSIAVLIFWALQGAHLTQMTWNGGYHPIWTLFMGIATLALALPAIAIIF